MTIREIDDSRAFETFRIIEKFHNAPEKLTRKERKRLKELGMIV